MNESVKTGVNILCFKKNNNNSTSPPTHIATALTPKTQMPSNGQLQLAVVPPSSTTYYRFKLPRGWGIRKVLRRDGSRYDRYYHEPGTGKKFNSLKEVQRYLNGEGYPYKPNWKSYHSSGYERNRMLVSGEKSNLAIVACGNAAPIKPFTLPDGWFVEEVPRRKKSSWVDKYYYECGTGRKFRSMIAVQRYLAEMEDNPTLSQAIEQIKENKPLAKVFKLENRYKNCTPKKKDMAGECKQDSSFIGPPMEVKWVLASPKGDAWNPFISETLVPDCVREQWTSRFVIFMNDGISNCQSSCA